MKKRYIFPAIFLVLVSVAGVFWWVSRSAESSKNEPQITTPQPSNEEVVVTLSLPGTDPLDARVEDYNDPASLWVVVNKDHPLSNQSYRPSDLMLLADKSRTDKNNDERSIRAIAVNDFTDFITAAKSAGYDLMIGSGFRSYDLQAYYHNSSVSAWGEAEANKSSAKPGESEHQLGLAADVTLRSMQCYLSTCFGDTPAGKWVATHAVEYGFIIRYPADKTEITKYQYEPWHLRYVGKPLAKALAQSGLTLDEALPYLQTTRTELIQQKKITVQ